MNYLFQTVSAFSPIANPINCPWGQKAFSNYLGADQESWKQYDTVELIKSHMNEKMDVLVDVVCMKAGQDIECARCLI